MFPRGSRLLLLTRSVLGSITNIITYFTIKHLPLSDVDIINATGAVIACVPSRIFLKVNTRPKFVLVISTLNHQHECSIVQILSPLFFRNKSLKPISSTCLLILLECSLSFNQHSCLAMSSLQR